MLTRSILRSLCALLVGILLVSNPAEMTVLIVQVIGGLFALSGIIAAIGYFTQRARQTGMRAVFPIVGIGSLAFGALLLLMPDLFIRGFMYVLGGLLALIGIGQILNIISYRRFAPVSWTLFFVPLLITAAGIVVICYPHAAAATPFTILGVAYIIYGIAEFVFGVRFYHFQRRFEAALAEAEAREAEAVEVIDDGSETELPEPAEPQAPYPAEEA